MHTIVSYDVFSVDPRVENWLMMQSYAPTLWAVSAYLIMVIVGPRIMANRKPVNVQLPMLAYNFALVLLSLYMFYEVLYVWCTVSIVNVYNV